MHVKSLMERSREVLPSSAFFSRRKRLGMGWEDHAPIPFLKEGSPLHASQKRNLSEFFGRFEHRLRARSDSWRFLANLGSFPQTAASTTIQAG